MEIFLYTCSFLSGIIIGSFLNVCIYRIPRGISIVKPRSACPACGKTLTAFELVPLVGYLALRGKCSSCRARIPAWHAFVELLCGVLWVLLMRRFMLSYQFFCYAALCSIFLAIFFIDLQWMRIPNVLVGCAMLPASAVCIAYAFFLTAPERFRSAYNSIDRIEPLLGLIPCAGFLAIYIITAKARGGEGAIGMGDIKLLIPAGLALGLRQCLFAVFIAVMLGGLAGAVLIISGKKKRKDPIPFGPFIVAGVYAAIFIPVTYLI